MCQFFSFTTKGDGQPIFFDAETRLTIVKDGNSTGIVFDSHASICEYFGLDEDNINKYEFNPFNKHFEIDTLDLDDDIEMAEQWARSYSFDAILASGCFNIDDLNDLPEGFVLPEILYGNIYLSSAKADRQYKCPRIIKGDFVATGTNLANVTLPEEVATLKVSWSYIEGVTLPKKVDKLLAIGCDFSENVVLPEEVGYVDVESATIPGMVFPKHLRHLDIWGAKRLETATLPEAVDSLRFSGDSSYNIKVLNW